ncbi:MAG: imidazole glycerol phosphate synthase subunit HisF [Alphaproteobacteria bacterium]|nr:imidazole glycerol phosphate synthase subunit HisF [Alphaproteobacteria bacterium]
MSSCRLIPRLDIKGPNLIKGIHLEGLRIIGDPNHYAKRYYEAGADELIYIDTVASLYGRNNLTDIVNRAVQDIFIPITVGGGIRSIEDATKILRSGADKIAVNTAAVRTPQLLAELANKFGSQCIVLSVEAKKVTINSWEVYVDNGREHTGIDVVSWVQQAVKLGVGEVLLTSIDQEGTRQGFDNELIHHVSEKVQIPIIASGGMGVVEHAICPIKAGASAVAFADILHYERVTIDQIRQFLKKEGVRVRSWLQK